MPNAPYSNRYSQVKMRIMKWIEINLLLIILLVSCQIEAENENIKDEQKINLDSNNVFEDISTKESIEKFVDQLSKNYSRENVDRKSNSIRLKNEIINESNNLIKYQFKSKELITNKYGQKSYQRPIVLILQFENKGKCDKAKELLMECFPNDCQKIEYDIDGGLKITPSIYLFSDKEIMIMKISCENENDSWIDLKANFKRFVQSSTKILEAGCGEIEWTR